MRSELISHRSLRKGPHERQQEDLSGGSRQVVSAVRDGQLAMATASSRTSRCSSPASSVVSVVLSDGCDIASPEENSIQRIVREAYVMLLEPAPGAERGQPFDVGLDAAGFRATNRMSPVHRKEARMNDPTQGPRPKIALSRETSAVPVGLAVELASTTFTPSAHSGAAHAWKFVSDHGHVIAAAALAARPSIPHGG